MRSGLRVSYMLSKVSGADGCVKFDEYVRNSLKQGKLAQRYEAVVQEVDGAETPPPTRCSRTCEGGGCGRTVGSDVTRDATAARGPLGAGGSSAPAAGSFRA